MEKWLEKRSIHTMNLRSVFTAEQQRILERYYENGMTNQSKSCFQLILQCAQETKLDFSVVRTWVGNKRRKLASKADQNGAAPAVSHQHVSCASVAGSLLTAEMAAMRSIQHAPPVTHLLPPQASSSSSSSSPSSSSPLSDVILTGIYANCFNASAHSRTGMKSFPTHSETEPAAHDSADAVVYRGAIAVGMHRKAPIIPGSSALKCSQTLKPFSSRDSAGIAPSWAKQQPSWPQTSPQKPAPAQSQHVFPPGEPSQRPPDPAGRKTRPGEAAEVFSIAMETGDAEDEYAREEELANMAAQMQCSKGSVDGGRSSSAASSSLTDSPGLTERSRPAVSGEKGCQTRTSSPGSVPLNLLSQTASRAPCLQVTSNLSAPWLHGNSRKRTLQDRTQFSDRDVFTLKRYWDKGMTSLGSLCREKISAAASELRVDSEIIKTWIGNRRRKYRLMGIEIPPPKGGPVVFPNQCDPHSPHILEEDGLTPELGEASEHNGVVSLCLSDDGASDLYLKEDDDVNDESDGATPAKHVKIEIVEEEDEDDDDDILSSEMEQMQNLLEFKNEEVQFLENELQSQKQKFSKLKSFTKSLLIAVKNKDRKKQRELLASLPQRVNEDWDLGLENHSESGIEMATIQRESSASEEEDTDQMRL
ncbi:highly divergent homeobox isoform X1 [Carassius auratus]|uniref:Highly divergent homeobox isoform X1 n=1 Tax=Carassius auratus TaxID=7957 RepID=A0A6P6QSS0_CARAU|nr:highly divergent homeobox isoform X1 [Carassius auratus]